METNEDPTFEVRASRWEELIIEDSFNAEMTEQEFAACCKTLIYHLNAHINAVKPSVGRNVTEYDEDETLVTPEDIVRENRNDDMASWLGVKR